MLLKLVIIIDGMVFCLTRRYLKDTFEVFQGKTRLLDIVVLTESQHLVPLLPVSILALLYQTTDAAR